MEDHMAEESRFDKRVRAIERMNNYVVNKKKNDAYQNTVNKFGTTSDPLVKTTYNSPGTLSRSELTDLGRYNWLAKRIISLPARDAFRRWISLKMEDKDLVTDVMGRMDSLNVRNSLTRGLILGRQYGGSLVVVGAQDGNGPEEPLSLKDIKTISFLNILDRWQIEVNTTYKDPLAANYGEPETYKINPLYGGGSNTIIHESRVIRFDGEFIPEKEKMTNAGWFDSVLQSVQEDIKDYGVSIHSASILMQDFITKVLKMPNLVDLLSKDDNDTALNTRIQYAIQNQSSLGITLIDSEEEYSKIQSTVAGLPDLLKIFMQHASAAANIPMTRLFGQQLGVLAGATETTRDWYDWIEGYQNENCSKQVEYLIKLFLLAKDGKNKGVEPEEWFYEFNSPWQETEKEKADIRKTMAETDAVYLSNGVVSPEEIAVNRFGPDGYSLETTIDFDERKEFDTPNKQQADPNIDPENPDDKGKKKDQFIAAPKQETNVFHYHICPDGNETSVDVEVSGGHVHEYWVKADVGWRLMRTSLPVQIKGGHHHLVLEGKTKGPKKRTLEEMLEV
jgi:hypothetical protein